VRQTSVVYGHANVNVVAHQIMHNQHFCEIYTEHFVLSSHRSSGAVTDH